MYFPIAATPIAAITFAGSKQAADALGDFKQVRFASGKVINLPQRRGYRLVQL